MTDITEIARSYPSLDAGAGDALLEHRGAPIYAPPGREAYLTWVASWKAAYHLQTEKIRDLKRQRADKSNSDWERDIAASSRQRERTAAHNLIEFRKAGKRRAAAECAASRVRAQAA